MFSSTIQDIAERTMFHLIIILLFPMNMDTNCQTISNEMTENEIKYYIEDRYNREDSIHSTWNVEKVKDGIKIRHHGTVYKDVGHFYPVWTPFPSLKAEFTLNFTFPPGTDCAIFSLLFANLKCHDPELFSFIASTGYNHHFQMIPEKCGNLEGNGEISQDHFKCDELQNKSLSCYGNLKQLQYDTTAFNPEGSLTSECNALKQPTINFKGTIFDVTMILYNKTSCQKLDSNSYCHGTIEYTAFPNLFGMDEEQTRFIDQLAAPGLSLEQLLSLGDSQYSNCFDMFNEYICHFFLYECESDGTTDRLTTLCKEMCQDIVNQCKFALELSTVPITKEICINLPRRNQSSTCFYKQPTCKEPSEVPNAVIMMSDGNYSAASEITYECKPGHTLKGERIRKCQFNGEWTAAPSCEFPSSNSETLTIALAILIPFVILTISVILALYLWMKKRHDDSSNTFSTRRKDNDVFLSYSTKENDSQYAYVWNTLVCLLEETCNPPFKLITHPRDFQIDQDTNSGIQNSNAAIIILSVDYINNVSYRKIIKECISEKESDKAFQIVVILFDPVEEMKKIKSVASCVKKLLYSEKILRIDMKDTGLSEKLLRTRLIQDQTDTSDDSTENSIQLHQIS